MIQALDADAKATFNAYLIAKDKPYLNILIESDCKIVVNAILGFSSCLWFALAPVEDIKLFLEDYSHVFLFWISHLSNMSTHESVYWVFNVIRSDLVLIFEIPPSIKMICNHK